MSELQIEIGKWYVDNSGILIRIERKAYHSNSPHVEFPYLGNNGHYYSANGCWYKTYTLNTISHNLIHVVPDPISN